MSDDTDRAEAPLTEITNARKRQLFDLLAARDGALCQHCGAETWLTIDHVDPKGPDILENLQLLCRSCNSSKRDRSEEDERHVGWSDGVWQRGFTMIPNAILLDIELSPVAFRLLVVLLHLSWRPNDEWPGQDGLSDLVQCSERTLRTALGELRDAHLVGTRRRGRGMRNLYVLKVPPRSAISAAQERRAEKAADPERQNVPDSPSVQDSELQDERESSPRKPVGRSDHEIICEAWTSCSPPLIAHRPAYFATSRCRTAAKSALAVYSFEDVAAAIRNYAVVLGSDDYFWHHPWPLDLFLRRGLDRFVPEADPLTVYSVRRQGEPQRRSLDDIDRL